MRQYLDIKAQHADGILFFRMGDFYEMFFEDAVLASRLLDLTLTSRDKNKEDAVPMCGFPHHASRAYVSRLTELGHKVVLVEQVEDPKTAKGLVKREVVRVITPGVVVDDEALDPKSGHYVACVVAAAGARPKSFGVSYLDVSTGEFRATELDSIDALITELARIAPKEIVARAIDIESGGRLARVVRAIRSAVYTAVEVSEGEGPSKTAAATVLAYVKSTQPVGMLPPGEPDFYRPGDAVVLDEACVQNLELCQTLIGSKREGSLLSSIDRTKTAPGSRLLKRWLLYPLTQVAPIRRRHDAVEFLVEHATLRSELRERLQNVADIERLTSRFCLGVGTPRELGRLGRSLARIPEVKALLEAETHKSAKNLIDQPELLSLPEAPTKALGKLAAELAHALVDEPPLSTKEGGLIRDGFCPEVDRARKLSTGGKEAVLAIETREKERTKIPSLKVKYNKVFGYYIEVTKSYLDRVPADFTRKQTVASAERFVTPELADLESAILLAEEELIGREQALFANLVGLVTKNAAALLSVARRLAEIDCLQGLAELANDRQFVRPEVDDSTVLSIEGGRHPVVEEAVGRDAYVPNDCMLDTEGRQILLITGPNMAGKSTYMRQAAHIALLAQMGSFVPAKKARVGLCDRIYTRVGAADNLARGESTFMVEMRETAAILERATPRSLVILDEIGRGTSTFDGLSIAWAVTEHVHDVIGARTLFATHYHELCALAETRPRIQNVSMAVSEYKGSVVFLREVVAGGASRSYGIDVARLAGLPAPVITRAKGILAKLESQRLGSSPQLDLFSAPATPEPEPLSPAVEPIVERLRQVVLEETTPLEAFQILSELLREL
jgi:DNA mismatch repair protein MutS